jgi:hypothetical protein
MRPTLIAIIACLSMVSTAQAQGQRTKDVRNVDQRVSDAKKGEYAPVLAEAKRVTSSRNEQARMCNGKC